jgi:hypothetical protein
MHPLLSLGLHLLWFGLLAAGCAGWGRWVLRRVGLVANEAVAEASLSLGLGLGLASYAVFALASLRLFTPLALSLLTLAAMSGVVWHLRLGCWLFRLRATKPGVGGVLLAAYLLLLAMANLLPALTPAWDWDGVAYHLALPKIYLQAGGFVFRPDIYHNLFPQFTEMLFSLGFWSPFGVAAKLIHWGFGLLAAVAVFSLGRSSKLGMAAGLAAVFFYTQYLVHVESGTAFIDLATTAYLALALLSLRQDVASSAVIPRAAPVGLRWHYLAALFAGMAAATKWHGLVLLACLGVWQIAWVWQGGSNSCNAKLRQSAGIILWGALPVIPYFARAWMLGGNPVWPLGYSLFGGSWWDPEIDQVMTAFVANFAGQTKGWLGFLRLAWDLLSSGPAFGVGALQARLPLAGLFLVLAAGGWLLLRKKSPTLRWPWLALAVGLFVFFLAVWFFSSPQFRYLLPLFPLLAWLAAGVCQKLWQVPGRWGKGWAILAAVLLLAVHPPLHRDTWEQVKVVTGFEQPGDFLNRRLNHYPACLYLNQTAKPGERVLLFNENRGFYLDADYLWGDPLNQIVINYRRLDSAAALRSRLQDLGVRWVLVRKVAQPEERYYSQRIVSLLDGMLELGSERQFERVDVAVYYLTDGLTMNHSNPARTTNQATAQK